MDKRIIGGIVVVGAATVVLLPPVRQRLSELARGSGINRQSITPLLSSGAESSLNLAHSYRDELVDLLTIALTNRNGKVNINDQAARQQAERLVDQGVRILETLVHPDRAHTIEGQVVEPPPASA